MLLVLARTSNPAIHQETELKGMLHLQGHFFRPFTGILRQCYHVGQHNSNSGRTFEALWNHLSVFQSTGYQIHPASKDESRVERKPEDQNHATLESQQLGIENHTRSQIPRSYPLRDRQAREPSRTHYAGYTIVLCMHCNRPSAHNANNTACTHSSSACSSHRPPHSALSTYAQPHDTCPSPFISLRQPSILHLAAQPQTAKRATQAMQASGQFLTTPRPAPRKKSMHIIPTIRRSCTATDAPRRRASTTNHPASQRQCTSQCRRSCTPCTPCSRAWSGLMSEPSGPRPIASCDTMPFQGSPGC